MRLILSKFVVLAGIVASAAAFSLRPTTNPKGNKKEIPPALADLGVEPVQGMYTIFLKEGAITGKSGVCALCDVGG